MILDLGPATVKAIVARLGTADALVERAARCLRDRALRQGHDRGGERRGRPDRGGQAGLGGRRRRHGGGPGACRGRSGSPTSRPRAARSSNGWRARHCRASRRCGRAERRVGRHGSRQRPRKAEGTLEAAWRGLAGDGRRAARASLHRRRLLACGRARAGRAVAMDCGDRPGCVLAALRAGLPELLFTGPAGFWTSSRTRRAAGCRGRIDAHAARADAGTGRGRGAGATVARGGAAAWCLAGRDVR